MLNFRGVGVHYIFSMHWVMLPGTFSKKHPCGSRNRPEENSAPPFLQKRRVESLISPLKIEDVEENLVANLANWPTLWPRYCLFALISASKLLLGSTCFLGEKYRTTTLFQLELGSPHFSTSTPRPPNIPNILSYNEKFEETTPQTKK